MREDAPGILAPGVTCQSSFAGIASKLYAQLWIAGQTLDSVFQVVGITRPDQQGGSTVFQHVSDLVQGAGGNGLAHRHVLEEFRGRTEKGGAAGHGDMR